MNILAFFQSLAASVLASLSSVGAALAQGFATVVMSFTVDQQGILVKVKAKFVSSYQARLAVAGTSQVDAIEGAATDAYNEFCSDESAEFSQECGALITLLESAAKSAAGILGTDLQTQVLPAVTQAAQAAVTEAVNTAETAVNKAGS
ncbi:MAG TPA: hypothetical protein VGH23_16105 [Rhizomicrobium sp.]|jgi:hypothetical protein